MQSEINGKPVNLGAAFPLTIGDMRKLKKVGVNLVGRIDESKIDIDFVANFIRIVVQKVNPEITDADIDEMTQDQMMDFLAFLKSRAESGGEVDRPT